MCEAARPWPGRICPATVCRRQVPLPGEENLAGLRRALPCGSPVLQMALIRVLESRAAKSALGQVQPGFHDVCGHLVWALS